MSPAVELPDDLCEVKVRSTLDGSEEPCLIHASGSDQAAPLLVGLHTWSADRFNQIAEMLPRCRQRGWGLILPEFRGPNLTTNPRAREAAATHLARQDIMDALDLAQADMKVDSERVFLLGGSGGGHMALMMAAYAPNRFTGISSWVPITDLAMWHGENPNYADHAAACCGGVPGSSQEVDEEYRQRSPLAHLEAMRDANLCVHHGRYDRSVPYTHTWRLAQGMEAIGAQRFFSEIFDGGHELRYDRAFDWFDQLALP
jgi:dipeptidyl aminopeptidase/acylaminoacyl peptidase